MEVMLSMCKDVHSCLFFRSSSCVVVSLGIILGRYLYSAVYIIGVDYINRAKLMTSLMYESCDHYTAEPAMAEPTVVDHRMCVYLATWQSDNYSVHNTVYIYIVHNAVVIWTR